MSLLDARDHTAALRALHRRARDDILSVSSAPSTRQALQRRAALVRGTTSRLKVIEVVGLPAAPFALGVLAATVGRGGVRVSHVPVSVVVIDHEVVVVAGSPHADGRPSLWCLTAGPELDDWVELALAVLAASRPVEADAGIPELSHRQVDVAVLVACGHTDVSAARLLGVSPRTVASDVALLFRRLEVSSRAQIGAAVGALGDPRRLLVSL